MNRHRRIITLRKQAVQSPLSTATAVVVALTFNELRAQAKARGINSFGMSKLALVEALQNA